MTAPLAVRPETSPVADVRPRAKLPAALVAGMVVSAGLVWQASHASLEDTVTNQGDSWQSGIVALTDDDNGAALFTSFGTDLAPGTGSTKCIAVTYAGDVAADVRLYLARLDDHGEELDTLLTMRIDIGSGSSCASPGNWTQLSDTDLRATANSAGTWAAGLTPGAWSPSGDQPETRPYRFIPTLADDNAAQGDQVELDFVWEAHST
ncbi:MULTISPECIES: hypothetical protein [unclassified Actinoplanes]|uniref:hypothetical protein n=1 Tax=unclassified Actinoplanes TaxID=2626549 RepID=UPI0005B9B9A9|nr:MULTISPECIES: hypothetical protein [unclassified Actinoplanes]